MVLSLYSWTVFKDLYHWHDEQSMEIWRKQVEETKTMPVCSTLRKVINAWKEFFKSDTSFIFVVSRGSSITQRDCQGCVCGFVLLSLLKCYSSRLKFEIETSGEKQTILPHSKHMHTWVCQEMLFEPHSVVTKL